MRGRAATTDSGRRASRIHGNIDTNTEGHADDHQCKHGPFKNTHCHRKEHTHKYTSRHTNLHHWLGVQGLRLPHQHLLCPPARCNSKQTRITPTPTRARSTEVTTRPDGSEDAPCLQTTHRKTVQYEINRAQNQTHNYTRIRHRRSTQKYNRQTHTHTVGANEPENRREECCCPRFVALPTHKRTAVTARRDTPRDNKTKQANVRLEPHEHAD